MKKCFVVSPIGDEGSEIRKNADNLFKYVIIPALEIFNFEIVRADKILKPNVITSDIIDLLQNADLCIIDLTGHNPNVYYECGRRHETGKPFIQLIEKGQEIPFDLASIRTIQYDLSTLESANKTITDIKNFVKNLEINEYQSTSSGESLSSIADAIKRIEKYLRKNEEIIEKKNANIEGDVLWKIKVQANPRKAFIEAYEDKNWNTMLKILPILSEKLGKSGEVLVSAAIFAENGHSESADLVLEILGKPDENLSKEAILTGIDSLDTYYGLIGKEEEFVSAVCPIIDKNIDTWELTDSEAHAVLNLAQRNCFFSDENSLAINYIKKMIELKDNQIINYYFLALNYFKIDKSSPEAISNIEKYLSLENEEDIPTNNLVSILDIYIECGDKINVEKYFNLLNDRDEEKAKLLNKENKLLAKMLKNKTKSEKK